MRITTVRITEEQHTWLKENYPSGFSSIVRQHLDELIHSQTPVNYHNSWREVAQKCYPFTQGGYCAICWPAGIPSRQEWSEYISTTATSSQTAPGTVNLVKSALSFEEWNQLRIGTRQRTLDEWNGNISTQEITQEKSGDTIPNQVKVKSGWFRWFWRQRI